MPPTRLLLPLLGRLLHDATAECLSPCGLCLREVDSRTTATNASNCCVRIAPALSVAWLSIRNPSFLQEHCRYTELYGTGIALIFFAAPVPTGLLRLLYCQSEAPDATSNSAESHPPGIKSPLLLSAMSSAAIVTAKVGSLTACKRSTAAVALECRRECKNAPSVHSTSAPSTSREKVTLCSCVGMPKPEGPSSVAT